MIELYRQVARYRADITHARSGEVIEFLAAIYEGPQPGLFDIRYSHGFKPEKGADFDFSQSHGRAGSFDEAEALVRDWAERIAQSWLVEPWIERP